MDALYVGDPKVNHGGSVCHKSEDCVVVKYHVEVSVCVAANPVVVNFNRHHCVFRDLKLETKKMRWWNERNEDSEVFLVIIAWKKMPSSARFLWWLSLFFPLFFSYFPAGLSGLLSAQMFCQGVEFRLNFKSLFILK